MFSVMFLIFSLMTPGPLDQNGGHIDPMTGQYHLHAGPSYQFRYVDASGKIWEGNGPRPNENLSLDDEDFLWRSPFVFILIGVGAGGAVFYFYATEWLKRRDYRRKYRRRR